MAARRTRLRRAALTALALALAPAPAATAAVTVTDDEVVVRSGAARAVVERSPFRMEFQDAAGRTVLEHAAPPDGPRLAGTLDPEPIGLDNVPENGVYAPLAFEVGGSRSEQWPASFWEGDMLIGARAGIVFFPTAVEHVEPDGDGVRLTLATNDPAGRTVALRVAPERPGALAVSAAVSDPRGVSSLSDSFASGADEAFRGFGGRHNALDQRGHDFYNWVEQENFGAAQLQVIPDTVPGSGGEHYHFPNGPTAAYYVQSLFLSSRPYGFLLDNTELSRWRMASEREDAWQVVVDAPRIDYVVAVGEAPEAIRTLTAINGRHRLPPDWALGPMLKRNVHIMRTPPETPASYRAKIEDDLDKLEHYKVERGVLPITGYAYEGWHGLDPEFVARTNERLHAMGIHPIGYVRAFVSDDGLFDPPGTYRDAASRGLLAKTPTGQPYPFVLGGVATGPAGLLDFTNPDTVEWWRETKIEHMLDLGFDGFMQDFGEQVVNEMRFHDGSTGREMHNRYPNLFHRVTRGMLDAYERQHDRAEPIWMYTRTGYSGRPGAAAYESSNFPGDESTDWQRSTGLPSLATDMLNRAVGGAWGYSTDIGGYIDSWANQTLDLELFSRWADWAALSPHFRLHNSCCINGTRMPWDFGEEGVELFGRAARLHLRAAPLIRRLWAEGVESGMPVVRPLWLQFPGDAEAARQDQQWMLGPDVLVAPVVEDEATTRRVYFPAGCWKHGETGERFEGRGHAEVDAPLGRLPWFVPCGSDPLAAAGS